MLKMFKFSSSRVYLPSRVALNLLPNTSPRTIATTTINANRDDREPKGLIPGTPKRTEYFETKRKIALWLAYLGTGYRGSQYNPTELTIEGELEKALFSAGFIKDYNLGDPVSKLRLVRSSRTDKGVNSLQTVVALKLEGKWLRGLVPLRDQNGRTVREDWQYFILDQCEELPDKINPCLPPQIQVIKAVPVGRGYDARAEVTRRQYEYYIPLDFLKGTLYETNREEAIALLKLYEGRHNWHNFTGTIRNFLPRNVDDENRQETTRRLRESRMNRFVSREEQLTQWISVKMLYRRILNIDMDEVDLEGLPCLRITLDGESFVLNQIRKMVSFWLMLVMEKVPAWVAPLAIHSPFKFYIPTAPPEGLILRSVISTEDRSLTGEESDLLHPNEKDLERLEQFRQTKLYPEMRQMFHDNAENWRTFIESLEATRIPDDDLAEIDRLLPIWEAKRLEMVKKVIAKKQQMEEIREAREAERQPPKTFQPRRDQRNRLPKSAPPPRYRSNYDE